LSTSGTAIWFCGLPGSGKTTISKLVVELLEEEGIETVYVSMDEIRKKIFPNPTYSDEERDTAYRAFVLVASMLCKNGHDAVLDATGHKKKWRDLAREECHDFFVEVYVKCPIETCIERETKREGQNLVRKKIYLDALERLRTGSAITGLGKVPGVDEPFEESPSPEITIDSSNERVEALARQVVDRLKELNPSILK
jgi:adenylylsulfate kinase